MIKEGEQLATSRQRLALIAVQASELLPSLNDDVRKGAFAVILSLNCWNSPCGTLDFPAIDIEVCALCPRFWDIADVFDGHRIRD